MPWSGTGTFVLTQNFPIDRDLGAPFSLIDADKVHAEMRNFKAGLERCFTLDGQTLPTANIPMNNRKFVNMAPGTSPGDGVVMSQISKGQFDWIGIYAGTADALTATLAFTPLPIVAGVRTKGLISTANASASVTLELNGSAPIAVKRLDGTALKRGDFKPGRLIELYYNGTEYRVITPLTADGRGDAIYNISTTAVNGTFDAYTGTTNSADFVFLQAGQHFSWIAPAHNSSTAPTISINGEPPVVLVGPDGLALLPNDIEDSNVYLLLFDGVKMRIVTAKQGAFAGLPTVPTITFDQIDDVDTSGAVAGNSIIFDGTTWRVGAGGVVWNRTLPNNADATAVVASTIVRVLDDGDGKWAVYMAAAAGAYNAVAKVKLLDEDDATALAKPWIQQLATAATAGAVSTDQIVYLADDGDGKWATYHVLAGAASFSAATKTKIADADIMAGAIMQGGNSFAAPMSIGTNDAQTLILRTNGVDRMYMSPTGIGTFFDSIAVQKSAPSTQIGFSAVNSSTSGYSTFHLISNSNSLLAQVDYNGDSQIQVSSGYMYLRTASAKYIYFGTAAVARVAIDPVGNFGIGNMTPTNLLDVLGASPTARIQASSGPASVDIDGVSISSTRFLRSGTLVSELQADATHFAYINSVSGTKNLIIDRATNQLSLGNALPAHDVDMSMRPGSVAMPRGTTAQRPASAVTGQMRLNTTFGRLEAFLPQGWRDVDTRSYFYANASAGTVTPDFDNYDVTLINMDVAALTINAPSNFARSKPHLFVFYHSVASPIVTWAATYYCPTPHAMPLGVTAGHLTVVPAAVWGTSIPILGNPVKDIAP
jgi:hypothetical protein